MPNRRVGVGSLPPRPALAPARVPAAHVEAAVVRTAQAKIPAPVRPIAPHVQSALARAAQAKTTQETAGNFRGRGQVPHVQAALAQAAQAKLPDNPGRQPHIQTTIAHVVPARLGSAGPARPVSSRDAIQLSSEALFVDEEVAKKLSESALQSDHIYRVMPSSEWLAMQENDGRPCSGGHFWSPTDDYVKTYIGKSIVKKESTSNTFVKIPLTVSFQNFLKVAAENGHLHPHNFGSAWKELEALWGKKMVKGKNGKAAISIKLEGSTPNIRFNLSVLPSFLTDLMGAPSLFE